MRNYNLKHGSWRNLLPILMCIICVHIQEGLTPKHKIWGIMPWE